MKINIKEGKYKFSKIELLTFKSSSYNKLIVKKAITIHYFRITFIIFIKISPTKKIR